MGTFKTFSKALIGASAMLFVAGAIGCGKKKSSGGSGTVATTPATCEAGANCEVGHQYASGVFVANATGQANYGSNQNMLIKLGFFAKDSSGLQLNQSPVIYNGSIDATGTMRLSDGRYYGVSTTSYRVVSSVGLSVDIDFGYGDLYYTSGGDDYFLPCGYKNCGDGTYFPPPPKPKTPKCKSKHGCHKPKQPPYIPPAYLCNIPVGDYSVETVQAGTWASSANGYSHRSKFSNLRLRFRSGDTTVEGIFSRGYVDNNSSQNGQNVLRGNMTVVSVNGQQCQQVVSF